MFEFVDLAVARDHKGIRIVVQGTAPSPWSEAAKGVFRIAQIPIVAVRLLPGDKDVAAWAGADNAPVVFHAREPARTTFAAIVGLVARLAPGVVLPIDPVARAEAMGTLELIAGEDGLGWNGRLAMIHAGLTSNGERGFPVPISSYLGKRYGYTPTIADGLHARVSAQLAHLADRLAAQHAAGHGYFGGHQPSAVDVYVATFLSPLSELTAADCPNAAPAVLHGFAAATAAFGALVPPELAALRRTMFERHLAWPIAI
jgi:glutathione S-transferase